MWLAQDQTPSYKTINRFRVNPNTDALIESLFIQFAYFIEIDVYHFKVIQIFRNMILLLYLRFNCFGMIMYAGNEPSIINTMLTINVTVAATLGA